MHCLLATWKSKIEPTDNCRTDAVSLAMEQQYDFPEIEGIKEMSVA